MDEQARHNITPKQVRYPTDCRFTSDCSPPRLAATQLSSITELRPAPARTFTVPTKRPRGRTHPRASEDPVLVAQQWGKHLRKRVVTPRTRLLLDSRMRENDSHRVDHGDQVLHSNLDELNH